MNNRGWILYFDRSKKCYRVKAKQAGGRWKNIANLPRTITVARDAESYVAEKGLVPSNVIDEPRQNRRVSSRSATVGQLRDQWFRYRRDTASRVNRQVATIKNNESHFDNWIAPKLGQKRVSELTVPVPRGFIREVRMAVSANHCRNIVATLKRFIQDCLAEGWTSAGTNWVKDPNVLELLPSAEIRGGGRFVVTPRAEEAQKLLDAAGVPIERRIKMAVMFNTGLSDGELHP
jgi:hypothetical protein